MALLLRACRPNVLPFQTKSTLLGKFCSHRVPISRKQYTGRVLCQRHPKTELFKVPIFILSHILQAITENYGQWLTQLFYQLT